MTTEPDKDVEAIREALEYSPGASTPGTKVSRGLEALDRYESRLLTAEGELARIKAHPMDYALGQYSEASAVYLNEPEDDE